MEADKGLMYDEIGVKIQYTRKHNRPIPDKTKIYFSSLSVWATEQGMHSVIQECFCIKPQTLSYIEVANSFSKQFLVEHFQMDL